VETLRHLEEEARLRKAPGFFLGSTSFGLCEEVTMKCGRCKGHMVEEELIVVGGIVRIKDATAWHCLQCGLVEYRSTASHGKANVSPRLQSGANTGLSL
jgi:hypothetical protein